MKIHHVSIVTRNLGKNRKFIADVLGMRKHKKHDSWFISADGALQLHVIEIDDSKPHLDDMHHYYRHVALEIPRLEAVVRNARALKLRVFQMDMHGEEKAVSSNVAPLSFGLKTVFVRDLDGNLWEFVQRGRSWSDLFK